MKIFTFLIILLLNVNESNCQIINKIEFYGVKRNNEKFLRNMIKIIEGDSLDSVKINNSILILNRLNGISNAKYDVLLQENNNYNLKYTITENYGLIPTLSIWTTDDVGAYRIGLYESNFLGKNNLLGGFYQYNEFNSFGINFSSPQFFSSNLGISLNLQRLISKEPVFFNNSKANYKYTNSSIEVLGNYQTSTKNLIKFGYATFNEKYDYLDGTTDGITPLNLDLDKQLIKLQYTYDNLNYNYYLVKGFKSSASFQYVTTQNNFQNNFIIGWNDFLFYKQFYSKGNWATRLRLGLSSNDKTPFAPFAVDNNLNIRGVGNIIDRGTGIIVLNTEYRKTLIEKRWFVLQGNAFIDSGTWRNAGGNFSDFLDMKNYRIYSGIGLRFIHKTIFNAVFRIDYGYGITKDASKGIVFGIGQYF